MLAAVAAPPVEHDAEHADVTEGADVLRTIVNRYARVGVQSEALEDLRLESV